MLYKKIILNNHTIIQYSMYISHMLYHNLVPVKQNHVTLVSYQNIPAYKRFTGINYKIDTTHGYSTLQSMKKK